MSWQQVAFMIGRRDPGTPRKMIEKFLEFRQFPIAACKIVLWINVFKVHPQCSWDSFLVIPR